MKLLSLTLTVLATSLLSTTIASPLHSSSSLMTRQDTSDCQCGECSCPPGNGGRSGGGAFSKGAHPNRLFVRQYDCNSYCTQQCDDACANSDPQVETGGN